MRLVRGLATAGVLAALATATAAEDFVVVVNPSVSGTNIHRRDLAALFLGKAIRWGSGAPAVPVDQSGTSAVRQAFSEMVLGMTVPTAIQYWQSQMLEGKPLRPPPGVKGSDTDVLAFVAKTKGAVGYVSAGTTIPPGVRAIAIID